MTPPPDAADGRPRSSDGGSPSWSDPRRRADGGPSEGKGAPPGTEVPESGIEVEAHLHYGMTGSFPLRLGDLFFADDGLYVAEYGYVTPFIGLASRKHRRESAGMAALYDRFGIDSVLVEADVVVWHAYDNVDRVAIYGGGRLGRPKVAIHPERGPTHGYRFHDRPTFEEGVADLDDVARRHGIRIDREAGLGFSVRESLRRFFWRPDRPDD